MLDAVASGSPRGKVGHSRGHRDEHTDHARALTVPSRSVSTLNPQNSSITLRSGRGGCGGGGGGSGRRCRHRQRTYDSLARAECPIARDAVIDGPHRPWLVSAGSGGCCARGPTCVLH